MTDTERMLTDDLRRDAELAPDPVAVLGTVQARVRRRKQRRRTGIAAVAAIALAGVVLTFHGVTGSHRPPAETGPPAVDIQAVYTFRFAWLPDGMRQREISAGPRGQSVMMCTVGVRDSECVEVTEVGWDWQPDLDLAGGRRVTVGGRPARMAAASGRALMTFKGPSGRWINLNLIMSTNSTSDATGAEALRIAEGLTEDGTRTLRLRFDAMYLPAGMKPAAVWDSGRGDGTGALTFDDGSGTPVKHIYQANGVQFEEPAKADARVLSINVVRAPFRGADELTHEVGQVNGKPAYLIDNPLGRGPELYVPNYRPGLALGIAAMEAPLSLPAEELLKIAQGVRWRG